MPAAWSAEFWRLAGVAALALFLGLLFDELAWALFAGGCLVILRQYRQLARVMRWLRRGRRADPPNVPGLWGEIVHDAYRQYHRNRRRKRKLAKVLNRFHDSSAAMPDATVILGASGEIEWFNDAAKRLLGLRPGQDTGRRIGNLIRHPSFTAYLAADDYREAVEIPSPIDDASRLNVRIVPYGKNQRLLSARDVTRLYRLEQMRRDFIGNVSHELRTPLTVITGYLETLTDVAEDDPAVVRNSMLQMKGQAERMRRIVEDLLMLTRLETQDDREHPPAEVAVPALLAAIEEDAQILSGEQRHRITLEAQSGLWLLGNPNELHSAFSNLVSNAVRYTPAGGEIGIRWYADDEGAHYEVRDTGIGIDPRHIPRLTERFYRVEVDRSRATGGTGLGLAIVKHVLQHHDAELRIESIPGKGSVFSCHFPVSRIVQRPPKQASSTAKAG